MRFRNQYARGQKTIGSHLKLIVRKKILNLNPRFSTARQTRARGVARPRLRESGSSKVMTSTQEPNRPVLNHFPLLSWNVVLAFVYFSSKASNFRQKIKMSSASESEMSFDSDDSDINFIPEVEIENARQRAPVREVTNSSSDEDNLFADKPLADEASTARYEQELKANEELEIRLNPLTAE